MSVTAGPDITNGISADLGRVISVTLIFHPAVAILMVMAYTFLLTSHFENFILRNQTFRENKLFLVLSVIKKVSV